MDTNEIISKLEECGLIEIDWDSKPDLSELHNAIVNQEIIEGDLPEGVTWLGTYSHLYLFHSLEDLKDYASDIYQQVLAESDEIDLQYALDNDLMHQSKSETYDMLVEHKKEFWLNESSENLLTQFPKLQEEYDKRVEAFESAKLEIQEDEVSLYIETLLDVFDQSDFLNNISEANFYGQDLGSDYIPLIQSFWKQYSCFYEMDAFISSTDIEKQATKIYNLLLSDSKMKKQMGFNLLEFYANPLILYPLKDKKYKQLKKQGETNLNQFSLDNDIIETLKMDTCIRYKIADRLYQLITDKMEQIGIQRQEILQELEHDVEYFLTDTIYYLLDDDFEDKEFVFGANTLDEYLNLSGMTDDDALIDLFGGINFTAFATHVIEQASVDELGYYVPSADSNVYECNNLWFFYV